MTQKNCLYVCSFRLFANPYLYLLSGMSDNEIELIDKDHESLDSLQFKAKMSQDNQISISGVKILEYLWSKTKFSQQKSLFFDPNSKNFIEIYELYSDILDLLSLKMIPTDKIASISSSFKLLILNEDLIQSPPLTMILYECLHALKAIDPSFLEKNPPLKKLLLLIEINPLYQSWLFSSINLMKPIGIFLPSPLQSLKENIEENLSTFIDFASLNSALYSYQDKEKSYWDHIPFSGFPTMQIHKEELQKLREKCLVWNKLFDRMVRRISIFEHIFEELGQVDLFVNHLWRMSQKKKSLKKDNGLEFCIFRNDYLKDGILNQWKQVEFNAMAASFGFMSDSIQKLHHVIYNQILKDFTKGNQLACLPDAANLLADGMAHAHKLYGRGQKAKILFVISQGEGNILDQRGLELLLCYRGILVVRKTFEDIVKEIKICDERLFLGEQEISLVYYRHGYHPDHYQNEEFWRVRELIEMSSAIKCPSVEFQLINFKKIQEVLQRKDILIQLLDTQEEIETIIEDFVEISPLDTSNQQSEALNLIKCHPENYVLKPQREGGGNNTYNLDIIEKFTTPHAISELKAYILMQRIKPSPRPGFLVKQRKLAVVGVISELGVYSYLISDHKSILENKHGGYLLRTKSFDTDEGGVATGYSVLDSVVYEGLEEL